MVDRNNNGVTQILYHSITSSLHYFITLLLHHFLRKASVFGFNIDEINA